MIEALLSISGGGSGEVIFTTTGEHEWIVPPGVYEVSCVAIGGGGNGSRLGSTYDSSYGGSGGGLGWRNKIQVSPGDIITANVGAAEQSSSFGGFVTGYAGTRTSPGGFDGEGGGVGGNISGTQTGGGGAGGYSGPGGDPSSDGMGGGGGGGGTTSGAVGNGIGGGGGGGVGLFGEGVSGTRGSNPGDGGGGGSNGENGSNAPESGHYGGNGGLYGGGGGAADYGSPQRNGSGANGAVRVIWGMNRNFPATNTDQDYSNGNVEEY